VSIQHPRGATRVFAATVSALLLLPLFAGAVAAATQNGVWSVGNASVVEGDSGTVQLTFTIHYQRAATDSGNVRVFYDTEDTLGTATGAANCNSGSPDYQHSSGNTVNTSSSTSFDLQVSINVCGDLLPESTETVYLTLSNPSGNSTISPTGGVGEGTIIDNDTITLDHIVISPKTTTTTAGVAVNYSVEAWDTNGNDLGDVTSSTTFDISPSGGCVLNACGSNTPGGFTVTGTYSGKTDTASLTVNAGALDHIVISPDPATIAAGSSQAYTAEAFDWVNNSLGMVTGLTTFTVDGSACSGASCAPTVVGAHTVVGTYSGHTDSATLNVTAGTLDHIVISPDPATIAAGSSQAYTAEAYDAYGNHWGVTGLTTFTVDGSACSGASCAPTVVGAHTVVGTYSGHTDSATLNVTAGTLDHIVISPKDQTIDLGDSQSYSAEAFDAYGNSLGAVVASYTIDGDPCSGETCTPVVDGAHTIVGSFNGHTDSTSLTANPVSLPSEEESASPSASASIEESSSPEDSASASSEESASESAGESTSDDPGASPSDDSSPTEIVEGETSDPTESVAGQTQPGTAPATGTSGNNGSGGTSPLFALLICAAFGGLALVTIQAQRKTIRR
jgi:hypothetical protein